MLLFPPGTNPLLALEEEPPFKMLATIMPLEAGEEDDDDTKMRLQQIVEQLLNLVYQKTGTVVPWSKMEDAVNRMRKHQYHLHKFTNGTRSNINKLVLAIDNGLMLLICHYLFEHPRLAYAILFGGHRICDYAHIDFSLPLVNEYKVWSSLQTHLIPYTCARNTQ